MSNFELDYLRFYEGTKHLSQKKTKKLLLSICWLSLQTKSKMKKKYIFL